MSTDLPEATPGNDKKIGPIRWLMVFDFVITCVLAMGIKGSMAALERPSALHFSFDTKEGKRWFLLSMILILALLCAGLYWLTLGIVLAIKRHRQWWSPWLCLLVLAITWKVCGTRLERMDVVQPIKAEHEAIYLEIARVTREQMGENPTYLSLDPDSRPSLSIEHKAIRESLLPLIPDYWPRWVLSVYSERDCVVLQRGSGMLGLVGVRIYDRGPVSLFSPEELKKNPYLPNQRRITDRLWYFTAD